MGWIDYSIGAKALNETKKLAGEKSAELAVTNNRLGAMESGMLPGNGATPYSPQSADQLTTKAYVDSMASSGGGNVEITKLYEASATADNQKTWFDTRVAQSDYLDITSVLNATTYKVTLDSTEYTYTSDSVTEQVSEFTDITVENSKVYKVSIAGTDVSYTSDAAVKQTEEITDIAAEDETDYIVTINGTQLTYTSDVDATVDEIRVGIKDAIEAGSEPVSASEDGSKITIEADTAGDAFTIAKDSGTFTITETQANNKATLAEITAGLQAVIDGEANIGATENGSRIVVTAANGGNAVAIDVKSGTMTYTITTAANNATENEVLDGIAASINAGTVCTAETVEGRVVITGADIGTAYVVNELVEFTTATKTRVEDGVKYILGSIAVILNGQILYTEDYSAADMIRIVLTDDAADAVITGDNMQLIAFGGADVYNKAQMEALLASKSSTVDTTNTAMQYAIALG